MRLRSKYQAARTEEPLSFNRLIQANASALLFTRNVNLAFFSPVLQSMYPDMIAI